MSMLEARVAKGNGGKGAAAPGSARQENGPKSVAKAKR